MKKRTVSKCVLAATLLLGEMVSASADSSAARVSSWTGLYVGANLGWSWQNARSTTTADPSFPFFPTNVGLLQDGTIPGTSSQNANGLLGGIALGYNVQSGALVYGIEADWMWTAIRGTSIETRDAGAGSLVTTVTETKTSWLSTFRGRLGVLPSPTALLYATGGLAIGHVRGSRSTFTGGASDCSAIHMLNFVCAAGSVSETRPGWTAGAGAEYRFAPNWTARAEYLL